MCKAHNRDSDPIVISTDDEEAALPLVNIQDTMLTISSPIDLTQSSDESSQVSSEIPEVAKMESVLVSHDTQNGKKIEDGNFGVLCASLTPKRCRETKLYSDGKFHAAKLKFHMNPTSIPMLDTPEEGVLHVILDWKASKVLSDLCYRYVTSGSWNSKKCGFLDGNNLFSKKVYKCNGINACPILLQSRNNFNHASEEEWMALQDLPTRSDKRVDLMEMKTARNLYVTLTNPGIHFCPSKRLPDVSPMLRTSEAAPVPAKCEGRPVLRQVRATKEWFVGCTHYYINQNPISRHYFHSLRNFTERARGYLQDMLEKRQPIPIPDEICDYVPVKKGRNKKRCVTHAADLVACGTDNSSNGRCGAKMILYEPLRNPHLDRENRSVTFALCYGSHNHPPPRQAASTERKNQLFRDLAEQSPQATAAALRLQAQDALLSGSSSSMQNLELSRNFMYNTLGSIRKKKERDDYSSLFDMMGTPGTSYVRDVRVASSGFAFLLATDDMLLLGTESVVFAGDATYKTVMEKIPGYATPDWYLYNIVAPHDITMPTLRGNVVGRALMTSLTTEAYASIWEMFIVNMRKVKADRYGLDVKEVSLNVPYMELEPQRKNNAIEIRAVTTDFEAAEVEGIALAIANQRGGSADTHVNNAMIGCRVHFERAYKKRAANLPDHVRETFKEACKKLRAAATIEEGDREYAIIDSLDSTWSAWLSQKHVMPLAAPCFSQMNQSHRMMAFDDTNIVESQNRRANLICGIGMDPVCCAQRLMKLDSVSAIMACLPQRTKGLTVPRLRTRKGHTLQPAGATTISGLHATQAQKGKKRKKAPGTRNKPAKKKETHDTRATNVMDNSASYPPSRVDRMVGTQSSQSIIWLHNDLGERCCKAVEEDDETLLVALSELYESVLESDNINKIKYRILDTMKAEKGNKLITSEFSKVLLLISKKQAEGLTEEQPPTGKEEKAEVAREEVKKTSDEVVNID